MDAPLLFEKVRTRLKSDSGPGGLWNATAKKIAGVFQDFNPVAENSPILVFTLVSVVGQDGFLVDIEEVEFDLTLYVNKTDPNRSTKAQAILARVFGNGSQQANGLSTYGLHRCQFQAGDLDTDNVTICARKSYRESHDGAFSQYTYTFRLFLSRSA